MSLRATPYYTADEYFHMLDTSSNKIEFCAGEVYMMAGGSFAHGQIMSNVNAALVQAFRQRGCRVYSSDVQVGMESPVEFYAFPDVSMVCTAPEPLPNHKNVMANSLLIVEILSPSTALYDRTTKFDLYKRMPSIKHYLLVEQDRVGVVYHYKTEDGKWKNQTFNNLEAIIKLEGFDGSSLLVADFYKLVDFKTTDD